MHQGPAHRTQLRASRLRGIHQLRIPLLACPTLNRETREGRSSGPQLPAPDAAGQQKRGAQEGKTMNIDGHLDRFGNIVGCSSSILGSIDRFGELRDQFRTPLGRLDQFGNVCSPISGLPVGRVDRFGNIRINRSSLLP